MNAFNEFFKDLADKMGLPAFFKGNSILFNNLFLVIFTAICVIALVLVIVLVPGKKKKVAAEPVSADKIAEPDVSESVAAEESEPETVEESVETPVAEEVTEEASAEEPVIEDVPAEETPVETTVEPVAEESVELPEEAIAELCVEDAPVETTEETAPVEETPTEEIAEAPVEEAPAEETVEEPVAEEVIEDVSADETPVEEPAEEVAEDSAEEIPVETDEVAATTAEEQSDRIKNGGKYEIVKRNGGFYFLLKANNGQLLLESSSYTTLAGVKKAIETFKNAVEVGEFSIDVDKNGNFKFILRASARSQMLYHGETYSTRQSAENAILSVKKFAFKSVIKRMEENDEEDTSSAATPVETFPLAEEDHKLGGKYEIEERNGNYYFLLKANNGQLLLESPAFTTEQGAKSGIETFKKAADTGIFVIDVDKNGNYRFILRASARASMRYFGESYSTRQSAESSVHSVRAFAQNAILK